MAVIAPKSWKRLNSHYKSVLRNDWYKVLSVLEDELITATVTFFRKKGLRFFLLPVTTGSISSPVGLGSDSMPVRVNINGVDTYLADSMQFLLEFGCRLNPKGAYYIAPSFRGEKADSRHLCQFFHIEAEIPGHLKDVVVLCEEYLRYLVEHLIKHCGQQITSITGTLDHLKSFEKNNKFPQCTFNDAVTILKNYSKYIESRNGFRIINLAGEKVLIKHFGGFVWLTYFDYLSVPFYQKFFPANGMKAINADLLMGIGETIGAGERHVTGVDVKKSIRIHKIKENPYKWYIDLKNSFPLQTSGFGMGVERFLLWLLNHNEIRDMQLLPRFNGKRSPL